MRMHLYRDEPDLPLVPDSQLVFDWKDALRFLLRLCRKDKSYRDVFGWRSAMLKLMSVSPSVTLPAVPPLGRQTRSPDCQLQAHQPRICAVRVEDEGEHGHGFCHAS